MIGHLVYPLISLLQVILTELDEQNMVAAYDLAKASGDEVISLERAIAEIEQQKLDQQTNSERPR